LSARRASALGGYTTFVVNTLAPRPLPALDRILAVADAAAIIAAANAAATGSYMPPYYSVSTPTAPRPGTTGPKPLPPLVAINPPLFAGSMPQPGRSSLTKGAKGLFTPTQRPALPISQSRRR